MKKIVFFFPWKEVSGGPYYLCRMADALAETGQYEVYYIDFYNSLSDDLLKDFRVRKIPYFGRPKEMEIFCGEPVVMITPIYWIHVIPKLHPDSRLVLINWHNECIPVLKKIGIHWRRTCSGSCSWLRKRTASAVRICLLITGATNLA